MRLSARAKFWFVLSLEIWHVIDLKRKGAHLKPHSKKLKRGQEVNDTSFSAGENTAKLNSWIFKKRRSVPRQTATESSGKHTITHTPGLLLLIYERRGPRRYLQTLNQKPSSTRGSQWLLEIESDGESAECKLQMLGVCQRVCECVCTVCLTLKASKSAPGKNQ